LLAMATIRGQFRTTLATRTFSTPCAIPSSHLPSSRISGGIDAGEVVICENTMSGQDNIDLSDPAAEAMQALFDLFSKKANPFKGCGRTYILEDIEGQLVFRRDEIDLIISEAINESYGKGSRCNTSTSCSRPTKTLRPLVTSASNRVAPWRTASRR
jgi:hypothetical protein